MELHLQIIGIILVGLSFIHVGFPRYFNWKQELNTMSIINRQMVYVHCFFVALIILFIGILCLVAANDLVDTAFGKKISLGIGLFWIARLLIQLFIFSAKTWKGKRFETFIHILFSILWVYFSVVFIMIYLT